MHKTGSNGNPLLKVVSSINPPLEQDMAQVGENIYLFWHVIRVYICVDLLYLLLFYRTKWIDSHVNLVHGMVAMKNKRPVSSYNPKTVSIEVDVRRRATSARTNSEHLRHQTTNSKYLRNQSVNSKHTQHQTANGGNISDQAAYDEHFHHQSASNQDPHYKPVHEEPLQRQVANNEQPSQSNIKPLNVDDVERPHQTGYKMEKCLGISHFT